VSGGDGLVLENQRITEEEFFNLFGELVRRQDSAFPVGTFAFMSPEQLLDSVDLSETS